MISDDLKAEIVKNYSSIMDMQDVSKCFRVSMRTVYRLLTEDKEIPAWFADGTWNVSRSDVIAYIDKNGNA